MDISLGLFAVYWEKAIAIGENQAQAAPKLKAIYCQVCSLQA